MVQFHPITIEKNVKSTVQKLKSEAETDIKVNKNIENISFLNPTQPTVKAVEIIAATSAATI